MTTRNESNKAKTPKTSKLALNKKTVKDLSASEAEAANLKGGAVEGESTHKDHKGEIESVIKPT